jgi:hypothetical protein
MLTLSTREARLGKKYAGKPKSAEIDAPRTLTFELEDIELDATELNTLLNEPHAHNSLYNHARDGIRPFLKCFKALELEGSIDGAFVQRREHGCEQPRRVEPLRAPGAPQPSNGVGCSARRAAVGLF